MMDTAYPLSELIADFNTSYLAARNFAPLTRSTYLHYLPARAGRLPGLGGGQGRPDPGRDRSGHPRRLGISALTLSCRMGDTICDDVGKGLLDERLAQ